MAGILTREQRVDKVSPKMFLCRLFICLFFSFVALYTYLLGFINFPCLLLVLFGAYWNFFVDINTFMSFLLCLLVTLLYSMLAIQEGLFVNAILYVLIYIPMQFVTWITNLDTKDMSIKSDKKLDTDACFYMILFFIFFFTLGILFSFSHEYQVLAIIDTLSACLLAISAYLQSFMYREYYIVRPVAVLSAIMLWILTCVLNGFSHVALTMIILYSMYLILDVISIIFWVKSQTPVDKELLEVINSKGDKEFEKEELKDFKNEVDNKRKDVVA